MSLEPIPETREALARVEHVTGRGLMADLLHQTALVEDVVPDLVGLSLALVAEGVTFTVAATKDHLALLDAVQYAVGGPCVDAAVQDVTIRGGDTAAGLLDEHRWAEFARASAAHGVRSTLSLPLHAEGSVVGGVNLYAATPDAFAGREERIATVLGAWAPGAVHNADLSFSTRAVAEQAPRALADRAVLDQATGVVVAAHGVDEVRARAIIADAASRAGQDEIDVARALVRPYLEPRDEEPD
jgi:GAF domain-containing protein